MLLTTYNSQDQVFSLINQKRLDFLIAGEIKSAILNSINMDHQNVILDISGVHFIDTAAFGMLAELDELLPKLGYTFCLSGVSEEVNELIELGICHSGLYLPNSCPEKPPMAA